MSIDEHLSPADWALVNWRKQDILQLRANGLEIHEIAALREISVNAVKNTQRRAVLALNANSIPHAIAIALRLEIIT